MMASLWKKYVCQVSLWVGESRPGIQLFLIFHARGTPIIMVRTFITLENHSNTSEVMERMFITLDGAPGDGEGIAILINYNTPMGVMTGISYPIGIPTEPPDMVNISIISTCCDYC